MRWWRWLDDLAAGDYGIDAGIDRSVATTLTSKRLARPLHSESFVDSFDIVAARAIYLPECCDGGRHDRGPAKRYLQRDAFVELLRCCDGRTDVHPSRLRTHR
jgi:hypothetical protein